MPKQVTLDGLELKGLSIFREVDKLRVEAHYSLLAGTETYQTQTRDVSLSMPEGVTINLEDAWDTILGILKTAESI